MPMQFDQIAIFDPLVVNDRGVAAALGRMSTWAEDLPTWAARKILGRDVQIGRSTSGLAEAQQASLMALIGRVGPMFAATKDKPPVGPASAGMVASAGIPHLAIGGVHLQNIDALCEHGVAGVAICRGVLEASDVAGVVHTIQSRFGLVTEAHHAFDELRVLLGTGTSSGVPVLGCDCSVCTIPIPETSGCGLRPLVFRTDGHFREMLIDCGPDLRHQALRAGLRRCDGIFVTHHHVDHIYGLDEVRRFNALMKEPIDLFAEERTLDAIHRVYRHIFDAAKNLNPSFVAHVRTHRVTTDGSEPRMGIRATPSGCTGRCPSWAGD